MSDVPAASAASIDADPANRRLLITGASGFIGRHCLRQLSQSGYEIHAVQRRGATPGSERVTWHSADLLERHQMSRLVKEIKPQSLLHLAWYVEPGKLITAVENLEWVGATLNLLRAFQESGGQRCVISGSCYEYDWRYGYCSEDITPLRPDTLYGAAKNGLQDTFHAYCKAHGISGAWARAFFMYGPFEDPRRLVSSVINALLSEKEAPSSHGLQIRDYMHVQDVADGLVSLLNSNAEGSFNVASGVATTIRDLVLEIGAITGRSDLLRIGALPARANDAPLVVGDPTKLRRATGWAPKFDNRTGLADTVDWWRKQLN